MGYEGRDLQTDPGRLFPLVSRTTYPEYADAGSTKVVEAGGVRFGDDRSVIIAGPCAVESRKQTLEVARAVKECGADMLRGGAFKPRTSPYEFQGLGKEGLEILAEVRAETGLPLVTEVMDVRLVELVSQYADMIQIGSRNMHCYPLLVEVGRSGKPVLLKRGMAASLLEWLGAAEYVAKEGNRNIVLCERGVRTSVAGEYSRFTLDLNVITAVRALTYLPVVVDPSHATGDPQMVPPASRAAIECGAHGLIIEVIGENTDRAIVRCDGFQGIRPSVLQELIRAIRQRSGEGKQALARPG
jgi:3-deoxy-7-phosphoheptulonate synthase